MFSRICPKCGFEETMQEDSCPECGYIYSEAVSFNEDQFKHTGTILLRLIITAIVILAIAVAAFTGAYFGLIIASLLVSGLLTHWILDKLGKNYSEWFKVAIAVQTVYLCLLLIVLFYAEYHMIIIDIIIYGICLIWYFFKPRLAATVVLCFYHFAGILMNLNSLVQTHPANTDPYIFVHLILHVIAMIGMIGYYWNFKGVNLNNGTPIKL